MANKIPYFILCKQLQAEKNLWEKERVALRRKVEELFAENVRLKKGICKGLDREAKIQCRKEELYKFKKTENESLRKHNTRLLKENKDLIVELMKYKQL